MNIPGRDNWFEDKSGARYIDADSPVVYLVAQQDTSALDLTLGIVYTVTYLDGFEGAAFVDDVHENLPHNSDTPTYSGGTPTHEGHTFTGWDLVIAPKVTEDAAYTAQWDKNKHTVTYNDGVDGEELFADDVHPDIPYGDPTPAFVGGTPMRDGYTFTGWSPDVAGVVTKDVTYRAGWKKDSDPDPTPTPDPEPTPTPTPNPGTEPTPPQPTPPADTGSGTTQTVSTAVKTGDDSSAAMYVLLAVAGAVLLAGVQLYRIKKAKQK